MMKDLLTTLRLVWKSIGPMLKNKLNLGCKLCFTLICVRCYPELDICSKSGK